MRLGRRRLQLHDLGSGVVLCGRLWVGDGSPELAATEYVDGRVVVAGDGTVAACGAADEIEVPAGARVIEGTWVGPGVRDDHVHLAFGSPDAMLAGGVVAVRDLGAPPADALQWRRLPAPRVAVAGPILTAPTGYPSRGWGHEGFAAFVDDAEQAERLVRGLAGTVDVVKLALEPTGGPVPDLSVARSVVEAAHQAGRQVSCHALTVAMVERALDADVDELAHTPTEPLPAELVHRIAAQDVRVVSTLQTFVATGDGANAVGNAAALVEAGVELRYGTDLGNTGTRPGVDERELELLADAVGLGAEAALRAATDPIATGVPAGLVVLDADPRSRPGAWRRPRAVVVGSTLLLAA